jgi:membrane protein YdbS with pleckstrin-like domain
MRPDPHHKIHPNAIPAWRLSDGASSLTWYVLPIFTFILWYSDNLALWPTFVAGGLSVINTIFMMTIVPVIRWKRWRYEINDHEIYLKYGIIVVRKVLIPASRIQNVDTAQGPIYRHFGLSSVTITTAATTHEIPALDDETADAVRNTISALAREADKDV